MKALRIVLALIFLYSLQAFAEEKKTYKVAVLQYMQETCTFCPGGDTDISDRTRRVPFVTGEDLIKSGGFVGGFVHTAAQFDDMEVVGFNSPDDEFVVKSRVHFRRGFDETGYVRTILVVDAPGAWFGTTRLNALEYEHAPIDTLYPFQKKVVEQTSCVF